MQLVNRCETVGQRLNFAFRSRPVILRHESRRKMMDDPAEPLEASANSVDPIRLPEPASIHVRALLTWVVIFPLVAIGMTLSGPFVESWHPVMRALTLTVVIVPTTVYFGVPRLLGIYNRVSQRMYARRVRRAAVISVRRASSSEASAEDRSGWR